MKRIRPSVMAMQVCLLFTVGAYGQTQWPVGSRSADSATIVSRPIEPDSPASNSTTSTNSQAIVPRLMKFSGSLHDASGKPLSGAVDVTFALYSTEAGGSPLWFETQSVQADELGRYTALLGAMHNEGLPVDLFTSGEVRWLGIQVGLEAEQPRVLLVSVPYALKAGDAETLGGKPASAYMLSEAQSGTASGAMTTSTTGSAQTGTSGTTRKSRTANTSPLTPVCASVTSNTGGTANYVAMFDAACDVAKTSIIQAGSNVGIGTASPGSLLHMVGNNSTLTISGTGTHQVNIVGATSGRLGQDAVGFFFSSDTNGAPIRFATNNGSAHEWVRVTSAGNVGIGTTVPVAKLDVVGSINIPQTSSAGVGLISIGGTPFLGACCGNNAVNTFLGLDSGNLTTTGSSNVGIGTSALNSITSGTNNTAVGFGALESNTDGFGNTALGDFSLHLNCNGVSSGCTGVNNTAVGYYAGEGVSDATTNVTGANNSYFGYRAGPNTATQLNNATAIGASAVVGQSNAIVLGSINGQNGATSNVKVGIGTATPGDSLDINIGSSGTTDSGLIIQGTSVTFGDLGLKIHNLGTGGINWYLDSTSNSSGYGGGKLAFVANPGTATPAMILSSNGDLHVAGAISAGTKDFKIDDPVDPQGKFLYHASVESSEMTNIYSGNITLDEHGQAIVRLPAWFEALNGDFRYQLTSLGMRQPGLYIASEVSQNRFRIAGGRSHGKVSWQVTGVRHDAYAKAHPLQVEEEKPATEQGTFLHPEAFGRQESKGGEISKSQVHRSPAKNPEPEASAFARGGRQ